MDLPLDLALLFTTKPRRNSGCRDETGAASFYGVLNSAKRLSATITSDSRSRRYLLRVNKATELKPAFKGRGELFSEKVAGKKLRVRV